MGNVYIAYNFSHFAIYLPKLIKIRGNLTKLWQKQKCTVFLRHSTVYICFLFTNEYVTSKVMLAVYIALWQQTGFSRDGDGKSLGENDIVAVCCIMLQKYAECAVIGRCEALCGGSSDSVAATDWHHRHRQVVTQLLIIYDTNLAWFPLQPYTIEYIILDWTVSINCADENVLNFTIPQKWQTLWKTSCYWAEE